MYIDQETKNENFDKADKRLYQDPSDVSKIERLIRNTAKRVWDKRYKPKKIIKRV